jgi:hypothetical protein
MQTNPGIPEGWNDVPAVEHETASGDAFEPPTNGPRQRRRLGRRGVIGIVGGALVLVLLVVAGFGVTAAGRVRYAPSKQVEAFLDDLVAGHVAKALAAGGVSSKGEPLLTSSAYARATDRVTDYRIRSTDVSGDSATVEAILEQGGTAVPTTFTLDRTGSAWGVFSTWKLDPVSLGAVDVVVDGPAGETVTVAGQDEKTNSQGTVTLRALPGSYPVSLDGGVDFAAAATTGTVRGFGGTASSPVALQATLTAAGRKAATTAVDGWLAGCVASTDLKPSGCSFEAYGETAGYTYTNRKWTLDQAPEYTIGEWTGEGWAVRTTATGSVTFTEDISGPAGSGTGTAGPISFSANGLITGFAGGKASYRSLVAGASDSTGS